jgi:hypothetical protein
MIDAQANARRLSGSHKPIGLVGADYLSLDELASDDEAFASTPIELKHASPATRRKALLILLDAMRRGLAITADAPAPAPLAAAARALHALPEDSLDDIAEKRRRFEAGRADPRLWTWQVACDLYMAAFFSVKTGGEPTNRNTATIPTTAHLWRRLADGQLYGPLVAAAQKIAGDAHGFHWPLEFPDIMAAGGFDVVLGNPPWERIKLQE